MPHKIVKYALLSVIFSSAGKVSLNPSKLRVDAINVRRGTVVDAVEDAAVFMRLADYYSEVVGK